MTGDIEIPDEAVQAWISATATASGLMPDLIPRILPPSAIRAGLEAVVPLLRAQWEAEQRDGFNAQVRDALRQFDGTTASAVALLTGMTRDEIGQIGGVGDGYEARAELDGADPCGDVYTDGPPLSRHTCGRPGGHDGAHRCRCVGLENYTWPATVAQREQESGR